MEPNKETTTTPVVAPLMTMADIAKRPLSYSSLKEFKRSPKHFMHYRTKPKSQEESYALVFGNLVDCLILTPDEFNQRFMMLTKPEWQGPPKVLLKEVGKDKYEVYKQECASADSLYESRLADYDAAIRDTQRVIITQEMYNEACTLRDVVFNHPISMKIIERVTKVQCEYTWKHKKTGLSVLGKFDGEGENMIFELKTTKNADPDQFLKDAYNFNYHIQCATYLEAMARKGKYPDFYYIVIEKTAPYGISIMRPSDDYIALGKQELDRLLMMFKMCMDKEKFELGYEFKSPYENGTHILDLPGWAKKQIEP